MKKGFTLIEVIIVLSILAILSSFSLAGWKSLILKQKLDSEANILSSWFNEARVRSMAKNVVTTLEFSDTGYKVCEDTNNDCECGDEDTLVTNRIYQTPIRSETNFVHDKVCFYPDGFPRNYYGGFGAGTVTLYADQFTKKIILSRNGKVRVE